MLGRWEFEEPFDGQLCQECLRKKIVKIRQSLLKLQSIMSGSLFWDTV